MGRKGQGLVLSSRVWVGRVQLKMHPQDGPLKGKWKRGSRIQEKSQRHRDDSSSSHSNSPCAAGPPGKPMGGIYLGEFSAVWGWPPAGQPRSVQCQRVRGWDADSH